MGAELSRGNPLQRMAAEKALEEMRDAISNAVLECAKLEGPLTDSAVTTAVAGVTKVCQERAERYGQELKGMIRRETLAQAMRGGGMRMGGGGMDPLQRLHADMVLHLLGALNDDDDSSSSSGASSGATGGAPQERIALSFPLTRKEQLGEGTFATVYAGVDKDGLKLALKQFPREGMNEKVFENEVRILRQLSHNNVIKIYGSTMARENAILIMELMEGSIKNKIEKSGKPIPQGIAKKYTSDLLKGLVYLHGRDVLHGNIRCSNILLDAVDTAKLADMGISKSQQPKLNSATDGKFGPICWTSPETVTNNLRGKKSDVWSAGCTVYEMVKGKPPFAQEMPPTLFSMVLPNMIENIQHRDLVKKQEELGPALQNFLLRIFVKKDERPFAEGLISHPWLRT